MATVLRSVGVLGTPGIERSGGGGSTEAHEKGGRVRIPVLDHGVVTSVETWGSDARVIEAARMSTDGAFRGWGGACPECDGTGIMGVTAPLLCPSCAGAGVVAGDEKLLRYLYTHQHHTPFEMAGLVVEVEAPIFVAREWMRHRTQSFNELSGRYVEMPNTVYVPSLARLQRGGQSTSNAQASGALLDVTTAQDAQASMSVACEQARAHYRDLLALGVARELARLVLPVTQYTRFRASATLRNWLAFLTLRCDEAAQWEMRQYAGVVSQIVAREFPRTWALWAEGREPV